MPPEKFEHCTSQGFEETVILDYHVCTLQSVFSFYREVAVLQGSL